LIPTCEQDAADAHGWACLLASLDGAWPSEASVLCERRVRIIRIFLRKEDPAVSYYRIMLLSGAVCLVLVILLGRQPAEAVEIKTAVLKKQLIWHTDYSDAYREAQHDRKMLLIYFSPTASVQTAAAGGTGSRDAIYQALAADHAREQLADYVCLRLPLDASVAVDGKPVRLLDHASFADLQHGPGLAIVDLAHPNTEYYTYNVSILPFAPGKYYHFRPEYVPVMLDLPWGTLTQRTMVFAVRIHPEAPQSTRSPSSTILKEEAQSQSNYQAQIQVQGHHQWESRFHRIMSRLFTGRGAYSTPQEVVAESWPNENLIDSCIDCVASWRQSPGHWDAVRSQHTAYGYDIHRGNNGIWYATGIFAN
jgi:hypothetical protein